MYVSGLRTEENAAVARGYAMALGVLPRKLAGKGGVSDARRYAQQRRLYVLLSFWCPARSTVGVC